MAAVVLIQLVLWVIALFGLGLMAAVVLIQLVLWVGGLIIGALIALPIWLYTIARYGPANTLEKAVEALLGFAIFAAIVYFVTATLKQQAADDPTRRLRGLLLIRRPAPPAPPTSHAITFDDIPVEAPKAKSAPKTTPAAAYREPHQLRSLAQVRDSLIDGTLEVIATERPGGRALAVGKLAVIDNRVDQASGTVRIGAVFDNTYQVLSPGADPSAVTVIATI